MLVQFDSEEVSIILELARRCLADAELFDDMADKLDLSDDVLKKLEVKIEGVTDDQP